MYDSFQLACTKSFDISQRSSIQKVRIIVAFTEYPSVIVRTLVTHNYTEYRNVFAISSNLHLATNHQNLSIRLGTSHGAECGITEYLLRIEQIRNIWSDTKIQVGSIFFAETSFISFHEWPHNLFFIDKMIHIRNNESFRETQSLILGWNLSN